MQSGHLVSHRGRSGGTFVAEQPPLAEVPVEGEDILSDAAWAVLDHRVAVEAGAVLLACERAESDDLDKLDEVVRG